MMNCPKCGENSRVKLNLFDKKENEMFRRHKCPECGHSFHTVEFVVDENESFKEIWGILHRRKVIEGRSSE